MRLGLNIAMKTVAGRYKDLADIESVVIKQTKLDWRYIDEYLERVHEHKDIAENIETLNKIKGRYYKP